MVVVEFIPACCFLVSDCGSRSKKVRTGHPNENSLSHTSRSTHPQIDLGSTMASEERGLTLGDSVRFLEDVPGMLMSMPGASKGALGQVTSSPNGPRVGVRVLSTGAHVFAARAMLSYVPPQPLGEEERVWLLDNAERLPIARLASWAICQRACHTESSLRAEYEQLVLSGEVARWKRHAAYCRTKQADPGRGIPLDLWRARIDVPAQLLSSNSSK
jgi:hypothetical protein